jgi:hypothetical protein
MPALPVPSGATRARSWGEGEGFVAGDDPDADDAGFLALFFLGGVVGVGHGGERAQGHSDFDGVRTDRGTFAENFVALDRAEVAFVAPVGDEVFHAVAGLGLPEFVGFLGVAGDERVEEMLSRALFGVLAEGEPEGDSDYENERNACENQRPGFVGNYRGRIEK